MRARRERLPGRAGPDPGVHHAGRRLGLEAVPARPVEAAEVGDHLDPARAGVVEADFPARELDRDQVGDGLAGGEVEVGGHGRGAVARVHGEIAGRGWPGHGDVHDHGADVDRGHPVDGRDRQRQRAPTRDRARLGHPGTVSGVQDPDRSHRRVVGPHYRVVRADALDQVQAALVHTHADRVGPGQLEGVLDAARSGVASRAAVEAVGVEVQRAVGRPGRRDLLLRHHCERAAVADRLAAPLGVPLQLNRAPVEVRRAGPGPGPGPGVGDVGVI
jgi:hypothetical protein